MSARPMHPNSKEARSLEASQRLMRQVVAIRGELAEARELLIRGRASGASSAARDASERLAELTTDYTGDEIALAVAMLEGRA